MAVLNQKTKKSTKEVSNREKEVTVWIELTLSRAGQSTPALLSIGGAFPGQYQGSSRSLTIEPNDRPRVWVPCSCELAESHNGKLLVSSYTFKSAS